MSSIQLLPFRQASDPHLPCEHRIPHCILTGNPLPNVTQCRYISGKFLGPDAAMNDSISAFTGDDETVLQQPRALKTQLQHDTWSVHGCKQASFKGGIS